MEGNLMGMSTYVQGFVPPTGKWQSYKNIWEACEAAHVEAPTEVQEFFDYEPPDDNGVVVDINDAVVNYSDANTTSERWEVDITKLPKDVTVVRFVNSY
jgi:hypothetical protein